MTKESCEGKKENIYQHYETQWECYTDEEVLDRVKNLSRVIDPMISEITERKGARILDLGSGPGIIPLRMSQFSKDDLGIEIIGIDISDKALTVGNRVIKKKELTQWIRLIKADCENLPFKDRVFDAVVSNATINLLLNKERSFFEMSRVIKDGGSIMLGDCVAGEGKTCKDDMDSDKDLWSACVLGAPTKSEFQKLGNDAGLEVINTLNLTDAVTDLIKNGLWKWPEFLEHDLDYYIFCMRKGE
jgi:ubiquinone/menaquinone biosynthesis C-methylase UbiE